MHFTHHNISPHQPRHHAPMTHTMHRRLHDTAAIFRIERPTFSELENWELETQPRFYI